MNRKYRNPVLPADYSDPDVIRDGDDFYLTASSFNCVPGLPILHSRDLVHWTIVNHALERLPHSRYDQVQHGSGVWAPAIRRHAGKFWIFFPMVDEGIYSISADHPTGRWSEPQLVVAGKGLIDPCPLWDEDGQAYLIFAYAFSRSGIKNKLRLCPMAPDGSRLLGEGRIVIDGAERNPTLEGPKFLKKDGYYYILAPAGGVATGWQVVYRARCVEGPYEEKVVLAQGSTPVNGPHQGALVDTPNGEWWFLHFQERQPFGRILHLQPVCWHDGWPLMGCNHNADGLGEPVSEWSAPALHRPMPLSLHQDSDDFKGPGLGRQWQWQANPRPSWFSLTDHPGHLRLFAQPTTPHDARDIPNLVLQKLQARAQSITVRIQVPPHRGVCAGLIVTGIEHAAIALRSHDCGCDVVSLVNGHHVRLAGLAVRTAELGITVHDQGRCVFRFRTEGTTWHSVPGVFQAKEGIWIGAKVGLFAINYSDAPVDTLPEQVDPQRLYADFSNFHLHRIDLVSSTATGLLCEPDKHPARDASTNTIQLSQPA